MNIGIVGSGKIVATFLEAMKDQEKINSVAICGREQSREKIVALARKYDIGKVYWDYGQMLSDGDVDVVYVALPNSMHYEYSLQAIRAGKNVICEKPFTSRAKELETLIAEAKKQKVFLFEAIITMYLPNYLAIQKDIEKIGPVRLVQLDFSQYSSRYNAFSAGELPVAFDPAYSGGALMDLNIYNIHFLLGLFGVPEAYQYYPNMLRDIDTSGMLVLSYGNFWAVAVAAKDSKAEPVQKIQGTEGTITVFSTTSTCKGYTITYNDGRSQEEVNMQTTMPHGMVPEFLAFEEMMAKGDHDTCWKMLAHSLKVMTVCEGARLGAGISFPADTE